ncbi:type II secretion system protein M [Klebsiella quasipneumoniae]|jgi:general secretion pathway protein M|uniref:type II secretion system protein M n=1 Tax=Klebsiella TaxID=570 RepID=UPI000F03B5A7|nr:MULTISPECIES: type II secretion system protein M [Klebsiella]HBT0397865.1 type II secretion system protein M [Klebsiella pneumoniae]MBC4288884.1 type II secretion system protein M [Klebsiella quasipneumoniae]MBO3253214.1 type II secretion system protein M [Klebsiella quasipneumoniae]MCF2312191.1 type II secretion system protein M [Klebsiella quasipneumoniae subsp. similipneumoniae]MCJ8554918.1 type II secretion system protein M [Klebsiella quasipneumoniae]
MANLFIWWRQRTPSEQRLLLGLAGLLVVCALWYGLWQPWRAREAQWRQTLVKEQASLRWMTQQGPRLQQLSRQPAPAAKEALTALVMREAASHGLEVVRLQPQGKRLQVTLQPCAFQTLMDWLDAPAMRGVNAVSLSVTAQPSRPGWVTVNHLLLERDDES